MSTPADVADTYGWYAVEGDAAYAPAEGGLGGRYFTLAAKLTPASVAQAAGRYLDGPPAVVTLTKSGRAAPGASRRPAASPPPAASPAPAASPPPKAPA